MILVCFHVKCQSSPDGVWEFFFLFPSLWAEHWLSLHGCSLTRQRQVDRHVPRIIEPRLYVEEEAPPRLLFVFVLFSVFNRSFSESLWVQAALKGFVFLIWMLKCDFCLVTNASQVSVWIYVFGETLLQVSCWIYWHVEGKKHKMSRIQMYSLHSLLYLCVLIMAVVGNKMLDDCLKSNNTYTMNVVLLEDNNYGWSRPFVQAAVERAIKQDREENIKQGMDLNW